MPKKSGLITQREADIGRRVRQVREQIKWPQPAFAAELDISRDRLASIEYGRTPLRYEIGYRLCVVFEIHPRWLAEGAGEMKSTLLWPDLPKPEGFPTRSLFSRIYDEAIASKPATTRKKPAPRTAHEAEKDHVLLADFDATSHVVRGLTDLLAKEKFRSPLERREFALQVTAYACELALSLRRERTRERTARGTRKKEKGKRKKQN